MNVKLTFFEIEIIGKSDAIFILFFQIPHAVSEICTADLPGSTIFELMRGSSHIQSVLICIEYGNCCRTLDVGCFIIWIRANSIQIA